MSKRKPRKKPHELALVGEVDAWEAEIIRDLLDLREGSQCTLYIDSAGGSVYGALAVATVLMLRKIEATAVVLSECSSATLLVFAACKKRLVNPCSTFLFHRMRWQSEKRVASEEAQYWARHFDQLEKDLDAMQQKLFGVAAEKVRAWTRDGQYLTGREIAAAGLAELLEITEADK
jgi:ATP-dependent protease ClpP protease subunit